MSERYAWEKPFFKNREEAARLLLGRLANYKGMNPLVLAIPRGAVPMGKILAEGLQGELDVILVHKIGAPDNPEFAVGAVTEGGEIYTPAYAESLGYPAKQLQAEARRQMEALKKRRKLYAPYWTPPRKEGRVVILVDDGIATGSTMMAAIRELRHQGPLKVVVATAAAPPEVMETLGREADEVVALTIQSDFGAVGEFFQDFSQVSDEEVIRILKAQSGSAKPK
jgi:putative phosphoribosyl transferase